MAGGAAAYAAAPPPPRPPLLSPPPPLLLLLLLLPLASLVMAADAMSSACTQQLEMCSADYNRAAPDKCDSLLQYSKCVRQNAKHCRGDLSYHSTITILRGLINRANCSDEVAAGTTHHHTLPPHTPAPGPGSCDFEGRQEWRHCLLFGDPHLKTFFREYQTCRVPGAWPLIDNRFLGVQVTNEAVRPNSQATATTKVTIVIRGGSHRCAQKKTYQATSDIQGLPSTFVDGTQRSHGPGDAIALHVISPEHVEIHVRYIAAVLVVRQSGSYLAFSARLPVELLVGGKQSELELCVRGCPAEEQLQRSAHGHALTKEAAWARCQTGPVSVSRNATLTDEYLDWCIFDVMTTGDEKAADYFTAAAYHAHEDVTRLDPESLRNRTTPSETGVGGAVEGPGAGAGGAAARGALAGLLAAALAAGAMAHARM